MEKLINMKRARSAYRRKYSELVKCTNCGGPTVEKQEFITQTGDVVEVDVQVPSKCPVCHGDGHVRVFADGAPSFRKWIRSMYTADEVDGKLREILKRAS